MCVRKLLYLLRVSFHRLVEIDQLVPVGPVGDLEEGHTADRVVRHIFVMYGGGGKCLLQASVYRDSKEMYGFVSSP